MKVLITSGGTKIPIDTVRSITNMSQGTFGSRLAKIALLTKIAAEKTEILFLRAENSKSPFSYVYNPAMDHTDFDQHVKKIAEISILYEECFDRYVERTFKTFEDYDEELFDGIDSMKPDIIVLAAAVSDYGTTPMDGKVRSRSGDLNIKLFPLPKLIGRIKQRAPNAFLVGFKLLVNSAREELIQAAQKSIQDNGCDLVVANDLSDIKNGNHKIMLVTKDMVTCYEASESRDRFYLAGKVFETINLMVTLKKKIRRLETEKQRTQADLDRMKQNVSDAVTKASLEPKEEP